MLKKENPLSPHLQIYKLQLTSLTSIMHRITGLLLYVSFVFIILGIGFLSYSGYSMNDKILTCFTKYIASSIIFRLFLIGWMYSIFYHLFAGIRHLFWDLQKGFDLKVINITGWLVLILPIVPLMIVLFIIYR